MINDMTIKSIVDDFRRLDQTEQRRVLVALLVLSDLWSEAQAVVDLECARRATEKEQGDG